VRTSRMAYRAISDAVTPPFMCRRVLSREALRADTSFAPTVISPLLKVAASGGEPVAVTRRKTGQIGHRFPQFLPDGRHFIYLVVGVPPAQGVYTGSLDGERGLSHHGHL